MVNTDMLIHGPNIQAIGMIVFHYRACMDTLLLRMYEQIANIWLLISQLFWSKLNTNLWNLLNFSFEALIFKLSTKILLNYVIYYICISFM